MLFRKPSSSYFSTFAVSPPPAPPPVGVLLHVRAFAAVASRRSSFLHHSQYPPSFLSASHDHYRLICSQACRGEEGELGARNELIAIPTTIRGKPATTTCVRKVYRSSRSTYHNNMPRSHSAQKKRGGRWKNKPLSPPFICWLPSLPPFVSASTNKERGSVGPSSFPLPPPPPPLTKEKKMKQAKASPLLLPFLPSVQ